MARWSASCETACARAGIHVASVSGTSSYPLPFHPLSETPRCVSYHSEDQNAGELGGLVPLTHLDTPLAKVAHADYASILHEARIVLEGKQERRELVLVRAEVGRSDQAEDDNDAAVRGRRTQATIRNVRLNRTARVVPDLCVQSAPTRTCWFLGH